MSDNGTVVARYRRHSLVESQQGERIVCQLQSRSLNPVVGDQVEWRAEAGAGRQRHHLEATAPCLCAYTNR